MNVGLMACVCLPTLPASVKFLLEKVVLEILYTPLNI